MSFECFTKHVYIIYLVLLGVKGDLRWSYYTFSLYILYVIQYNTTLR